MTDDGRGYLIHIPSMIISKRDGEKLIDCFMNKNSHIILSISLKIDNPDNWVEYDMYYSSILDLVDFDFDGFNRIDSIL